MKLFTTKQIAELDKFTIENEPISDIDLMERASQQITNWLSQHFSAGEKMVFFVGPGNNGGDALAVARQMARLNFICEVYLLDLGKDLKGSPKINWQRLEKLDNVDLFKLTSIDNFPKLSPSDVIIDGLFGSGLTRALRGLPAEVVHKINQQKNTVVAIDIPSGLMGEDNTANDLKSVIKADFTLTFQFPKIAFLFPENNDFVGKYVVLPIGLHPGGIKKTASPYSFILKEDVCRILPQRKKFDHKGTFGHALLIAGSFGKMGAAVLASKACLRSGVGLLTTHVPQKGCTILQTAVPEAMTSVDQHDSMFTEFPPLENFSAVGIGPGLNTKYNSKKALADLLGKCKVPLVIDADGINILASNKSLFDKLPKNTILTPHPGEFRRLVGETQNSSDRIRAQLDFSKKYNVVVVVKGAHSCISTPGGELYFNSTGNPGMATAGSGDVLTGVILALLAQGLNPRDAAIAGVFVHGLAGDLAAEKISEYSLIAGDIIANLGFAFQEVKQALTK